MKCPKCYTENTEKSRFCSHCATPLSFLEDVAGSPTQTFQMSLKDLDRGTTFAKRYEVIEELGRGGMGRVYKVYDKKIKENVALKLIRPEVASDARTLERFSTELRLARRISHRNVCRMYDIGEEAESHFITMEFVQGENLKSIIRMTKQFSMGSAVNIGKQLCEGLAEAHRLGVVHRDLKPQNIMIDREGNARIMDFGIARSIRADGITGTGVIIGTPEYMSPEQAEAKEVDQRSDIYSLGVILYEMVTGQLPFKGDTPLSIAIKHKTEEPEDPRSFNPHLSEDFAGVILKCMAKDRELRYQTAMDLHEKLSMIEKGLPTAERPLKRELLEKKPDRIRTLVELLGPKKFLVLVAIIAMTAIAIVMGIFQDRGQKVLVSPPQQTETTELKDIPVPPVPEKSISRGDLREARDRHQTLESVRATPEATGVQESGRGVLGMIMGEATKYIGEEELKKIEEMGKLLTVTRGDFPGSGVIKDAWKGIEEKIREASKLQQEGKAEEAQKIYSESQKEMSALMAMSKEKYETDQARSSMDKTMTQVKGLREKITESLLYRVALSRLDEADKLYQKNEFSEAKAFFSVLERVFILSMRSDSDSQGLEELKNFVTNLRRETEALKASSGAREEFEHAREYEKKAEIFSQKGDHENAAGAYIEASVFYEMARQKVTAGPKSVSQLTVK